MPRVYKKESERQVTLHATMSAAVRRVVDGESLRIISREFEIPRSTLSRYVSVYKQDETAILEANFKKAQIFCDEQEQTFVDYLIKTSDMFYGLTITGTRQSAYMVAKTNHIDIPKNWIDSEIAGYDWLQGFLTRHPRLSVRQPEATSLARAAAFNKVNVQKYFDLLQSLIQDFEILGKYIYNLDESGCATVQKVPKIIAQKGQKQVAQITSRERGELVTLCGIISATGVALPPVLVFPRKKYHAEFLNGSPEGSLGLAAPS